MLIVGSAVVNSSQGRVLDLFASLFVCSQHKGSCICFLIFSDLLSLHVALIRHATNTSSRQIGKIGTQACTHIKKHIHHTHTHTRCTHRHSAFIAYRHNLSHPTPPPYTYTNHTDIHKDGHLDTHTHRSRARYRGWDVDRNESSICMRTYDWINSLRGLIVIVFLCLAATPILYLVCAWQGRGLVVVICKLLLFLSCVTMSCDTSCERGWLARDVSKA